MVMGWKVADSMSERVRFISAWLNHEESLTGFAARFGVPRKTAYKSIDRYRAEGPSGLAERTSAPLTQAAQTWVAMVAQIVALPRRGACGGDRLRVPTREETSSHQEIFDFSSILGAGIVMSAFMPQFLARLCDYLRQRTISLRS